MALQTNGKLILCLLVLCQGSAASAASAAADGPVDLEADQLAVFVLQRGAYVRSDMGVFMTLGGRRGYSNAQPYLGLAGGWDLDDRWSLQLTLANGYASGNPVSANNDPRVVGPHAAVSYGLLMVGGEAVLALRPRERVAIEPRLGAGVTWLSSPLAAANDAHVTLSGTSPHIAAGVDIKYLTLLTDFAAGVSLTSYFVTAPRILAVGLAGVVRYTF